MPTAVSEKTVLFSFIHVFHRHVHRSAHDSNAAGKSHLDKKYVATSGQQSLTKRHEVAECDKFLLRNFLLCTAL